MRFLGCLAFFLLVFAVGCPKEKRAIEAAQKAVELSAETVDVLDVEFNKFQMEAGEQALEECPDSECFYKRMEPYQKGTTVIASMKLSLLTLDSTLEAWEAGSPNGRSNFREAAACFLYTLMRLDQLLEGVGVDLPNLQYAIDTGVDLLGFEDGFTCPEEA